MLVFALGVEVATSVIGGIVVGLLLDKKFETTPFTLILGAILGTLIAVFRLIKFTKLANKLGESEDQSPKDGAP